MPQAAVPGTGRFSKKGAGLPRFQPLCLACVLWVSVMQAQSSPAPAEQAPPASTGASLTSLNSLQGSRVAEVRIAGAAIDHPEWLAPLIQQKVNEPLDKYKVRGTVQALYDTGRFAEIQVEAQRNSS